MMPRSMHLAMPLAIILRQYAAIADAGGYGWGCIAVALLLAGVTLALCRAVRNCSAVCGSRRV